MNQRASLIAARNHEAVIREFYACYAEGRPDRFGEIVTADYLDFGHEPPGEGPAGACADYEQAAKKVGGITTYKIDALVSSDEYVAVVWTGTLPSKRETRGLSLYRVVAGRVASTRHAHLSCSPARLARCRPSALN